MVIRTYGHKNFASLIRCDIRTLIPVKSNYGQKNEKKLERKVKLSDTSKMRQ